MSHPNPSTALARVIVDELSIRGVEVVVISPGSRSGALAIAAAEHSDIDARVFIDERSAAFHALGIARATGRPAAVISTSGTAPANYMPAVVEADVACVPLVIVSADRPEELHGIGANQTIDQQHLFGKKVRRFEHIEAPDGTDQNETWRSTVQSLVADAIGSPPGPVHLNAAFREPTVPVTDDGRSTADPYQHATQPLVGQASDNRPEVAYEAPPFEKTRRGLVVAGDGEYDRGALAALAAERGWPVLATALSSMRGGSVVTAYRRIVAEEIDADMVPDVALVVGSIGPDPSLERLIAKAAVNLRVDAWGRHLDPSRNASAVLAADPVAVLEEMSQPDPAPGWLDRWLTADGEARSELEAELAAIGTNTCGGVANVLNSTTWDALVVGSSLPIREVDLHLTRPGRVYANRGASGIDGFVSTALGVASVHTRTVAFCGDLTFLHDTNGFLNDAEIDATFVVIDNGGGGLFDSLPQAGHAPHFERLFVTPPRRDLSAVASAHGLDVSVCDELTSLAGLVESNLAERGVGVVIVPVDRIRDAEARTQIGR